MQGGGPPFVAHSKPLIDYITLVNVFQGCASLAPANAAAPLNLAPSPARCADLTTKGLLTAATLADQATEAQEIINDYGILPEQNLVQPGYWFANVVAVDLGHLRQHLRPLQRARQSVRLQLRRRTAACRADRRSPLAAAERGADLRHQQRHPADRRRQRSSTTRRPAGRRRTAARRPSQNLDGALCLRSLATGKDAVTGAPLAGDAARQAQRIAEASSEILATGKLRRVPAMFVTGRNDGILPPNFTSRAYFGLNNVVDGSISSLRYYEVTNAQHLDTLQRSSRATTTSTSRCTATSSRRWI